MAGPSGPTDEPVEDARASALHTLDVWNAQLAQAGAELLYARLRLLRDLGPYLGKAYDEVSAGQSDATVAYRSSLREDRWPREIAAGAVPEMQELHDEILADASSRCAPAEVERGVSLVGPAPRRRGPDPGALPGQGVRQPRRVLVVRARRCGSRRTSCCGTTSATTRCSILDDVFAELDSGRRDRLAALIADCRAGAGHRRGAAGRARSR